MAVGETGRFGVPSSLYTPDPDLCRSLYSSRPVTSAGVDVRAEAALEGEGECSVGLCQSLDFGAEMGQLGFIVQLQTAQHVRQGDRQVVLALAQGADQCPRDAQAKELAMLHTA